MSEDKLKLDDETIKKIAEEKVKIEKKEKEKNAGYGCLFILIIAAIFVICVYLQPPKPKNKMMVELWTDNRTLVVQNKNTFNWVGCTIEINDKYKLKHPYFFASDAIKFQLIEFTDEAGNRFMPIVQKVNSCRVTAYDSTQTFLIYSTTF